MGTFDDNRRAFAERTDGFRTVGFRLDPPGGDLGLRRELERFPFVPADPARLEQDCYEGYSIQVVGPGAADAGDRAPQARHRRVRRPRLDPRPDRRRAGDGPRKPAAQRHHRVHPARVRHRNPDQGQRAAPDGGPRDHLRGARHHRDRAADADATSATRSPRASRSTTSRSRTCRPGCAPTTCSAPRTSAAASCWAPATCPSWRWAGAPTASATRCRTTTSTAACRRR